MSTVTKLEPPKRSILGALAERYGMDPKMFELTIRATTMPSPHTDEEFAACCLVAHEHKLNPITKEIYFMRSKGGGIQPIVGVDGWIKKCNEHPAFNGIDFEDAQDAKGILSAIKCIIHRKDREHPIVVTEYLVECKRETPTWKQMPSRMLRHRSLIQCARVAFGFAGLMDPDEFEQWQDRYRGDAARDITPAAAPALTPPPIPEPAEEPVDQTEAVSDEKFKAAFEGAVAAVKNFTEMDEVVAHNELEWSDRGLQQWAGDILEAKRKQLY